MDRLAVSFQKSCSWTVFRTMLALAALHCVSGKCSASEERQPSSVPAPSGCDHPLGMESGRIPDANLTASSSFNHMNVGPQNGRLCVERNEGAWCPNEMIRKGVYEWLQVDLGQDFLLTAVATQGRFGNGNGREFADFFRLEYTRNTISTMSTSNSESGWIRYKMRNGSEVFSGNRNTYMTEKRYLDPPVVASMVRIVPHTFHHRTVCMRIELYGCPFSGGLESYDIPASTDELTFEAQSLLLADDSYDGHKSRVTSSSPPPASSAGFYRDGLGQLTDGVYGPQDVTKDRGYDWVGWKNTTGGHLELTFTFKTSRVFHEVVFHAANIPAFGIGVFSRASVFLVEPHNNVDWTKTTEKLVASKALASDFTRDFVRNISIRMPSSKLNDDVAIVGKVVKIKLHFGDEWIFLSEVVFNSDEIDPSNPLHVLPSNFSLPPPSPSLSPSGSHPASSFSVDDVDRGKSAIVDPHPGSKSSIKPHNNRDGVNNHHVRQEDSSSPSTAASPAAAAGGDKQQSTSSTPDSTHPDATSHSAHPPLWAEILIVSMTLAGVILVGLAVVCAVRAMLGHWPPDGQIRMKDGGMAMGASAASNGTGMGPQGSSSNSRHSWFTKKTYQMENMRTDMDRNQANCRISLTNDQIVTVGSEYSALDRTTLCTEYSLLDDNFCQQQHSLQLRKQQQGPHCWQSAKDVSNLSSPESIYTDTYSAEYASPLISNLPGRNSFHAKSPTSPRHQFLLASMKPSATTGALSTFQPSSTSSQSKIDISTGASAITGASGSNNKAFQGYKSRKKRQQEQPYATTDILCINNNVGKKDKQMHQPQVFFLTQRESPGELSFSPFQQQAASWSTGNIFDGPRHQQQQQQ